MASLRDDIELLARRSQDLVHLIEQHLDLSSPLVWHPFTHLEGMLEDLRSMVANVGDFDLAQSFQGFIETWEFEGIEFLEYNKPGKVWEQICESWRSIAGDNVQQLAISA